jgi:hypothetical protein
MTDLLKLVKRRTKTPFHHYRKRIVVSLEPGDIISMRLERTRKAYRAPLSAIFIILCQWEAAAQKPVVSHKSFKECDEARDRVRGIRKKSWPAIQPDILAR